MGVLVTISWVLLAGIHVVPAAALLSRRLAARLYALELQAELTLLVRHRAVMFLIVIVACVSALVDPASRRLASVVVALSMLSFLALYVGARWPAGPLRKVALVDGVGVVPLVVIVGDAWG